VPPTRPLRHDDVDSTVETRCPAGHPQVLRCYPLRKSSERFEPFPTLFWLVCPRLVDALSKLEHDGWIQRLSSRLEVDAAFRAEVEADHRAYIAERFAALSWEDQYEVRLRDLEADFSQRGIGGIRDFGYVKCLHLHYAHHLARGSAIGRALDAAGGLAACPADGE